MQKRPLVAADSDRALASEGPAAAPYELCIDTPLARTALRLFEGASYVVGRGRDCEICVDDAAVSRMHARIIVDDGVWVEDLGARNVTVVDGKRLRPAERAPFRMGAVVTVGTTALTLREAASPVSESISHERASLTTCPPPPELESPLEKAVDRLDRTMEVAAVAHVAREPPATDDVIVIAPAMRELYTLASEIAPTPLRVLMLGETGTGKDVLAHEIHKRSDRASGPFVQLNGAALPEALLEAELFGYDKGAFTGAMQPKQGLVEAAHGGTLFLDEIGEMPMTTQAKLLLFLESGHVQRIGSVRPRPVNVRVLSATNKNLTRAIAVGTFRADLFFRLNGISLHVPPLRNRVVEITPLAQKFATRAARNLGRRAPTLTSDAIDKLNGWHWPGNVRELRNVMERAAVLCRGTEITPVHLHIDDDAHPRFDEVGEPPTMVFPSDGSLPPQSVRPSDSGSVPALPSASRLQAHIKAVERDRILEALATCGGNQSRAARTLGISRTMLINRIEAYGLTRPRKSTKE